MIALECSQWPLLRLPKWLLTACRSYTGEAFSKATPPTALAYLASTAGSKGVGRKLVMSSCRTGKMTCVSILSVNGPWKENLLRCINRIGGSRAIVRVLVALLGFLHFEQFLDDRTVSSVYKYLLRSKLTRHRHLRGSLVLLVD